MTNKATLQTANAAVARGDNESFLHYCTEDVTWTFVGDTKLQGKEAVRQYMAEVYVQPPVFDVKQLIAEGDYITVVGNITLMEAGEEKHYAYCDIWRFREGKMAELTAFVI